MPGLRLHCSCDRCPRLCCLACKLLPAFAGLRDRNAIDLDHPCDTAVPDCAEFCKTSLTFARIGYAFSSCLGLAACGWELPRSRSISTSLAALPFKPRR